MFLLPFINNKITAAGISGVKVLLRGVDIGEDGNKRNDETQNPDSNNQGNYNVATENKQSLFVQGVILFYICQRMQIKKIINHHGIVGNEFSQSIYFFI